MHVRPPLIERAYELAKSGTVPNVDGLVRELTREGYDLVEAHLRGGMPLRRQLHGICKKAWADSGKEPVSVRGRHPKVLGRRD